MLSAQDNRKKAGNKDAKPGAGASACMATGATRITARPNLFQEPVSMERSKLFASPRPNQSIPRMRAVATHQESGHARQTIMHALAHLAQIKQMRQMCQIGQATQVFFFIHKRLWR